MSHITRDGYVIPKETLSDNELKELKNNLMVKPYIPEDFDTKIVPYPVYVENENNIIVPRYYGVDTFGTTKRKFEYEETNYKFTGELRKYQLDIVDKVLPKIKHDGGGLISLPCGRGKTVIALYLAYKLKCKTLVLVHKSFLQDQWIDRAKAFTTAKLGSIRQKKIDVEGKDIVIGMIQSISMKTYDKNVFDSFGLVIVDECHHIASRIFSKALRKTASLYTLGLSATPKRSDGLTKVINWYLGDMLYQEDRKQDHNVIVRKLDFQLDDPLFEEKMQWLMGKLRPSIPKMITNLSKIKRRNEIILSIIDKLRANPKRKILVLSGRIEHLELLKKECDLRIQNDVDNGILMKDEIKTFFYIGKLKQAERKEAELYGDILFASYDMAHEGLDIDRLNTVLLVTPKKSITQAIGRIMRKILTASDIKPLIVDMTDNLSIFKRQGFVRYKLYKKNKYVIKEFMVDNNYICPLNDYVDDKIPSNKNIQISSIFEESELNNIDTSQELEINEHKTNKKEDIFNFIY